MHLIIVIESVTLLIVNPYAGCILVYSMEIIKLCLWWCAVLRARTAAWDGYRTAKVPNRTEPDACHISPDAWLETPGACCKTSNAYRTASDACRAAAIRLLQRLRLPPARLQQIALVEKDLRYALRTRWPEATVTPFGAIMSGLGILGSDIDYYAHLEGSYHENIIYEVQDLLGQFPHAFRRPQAVVPAAMPHVRFIHIDTGYQCDVSFKQRDGVHKTALMKYYMDQDRTILDLTTIIKYWAKIHKPFNRRRILSNFAVVILVIFYLQQKNILLPVAALQENSVDFIGHWNMGFNNVTYRSSNNSTLYQLLGGFFQYYSQFDFDKYIVSTYMGKPIKRADFEHISLLPKVYDLYKCNVDKHLVNTLNISAPALIQDPFMHNNNIAYDMTKEVLKKFKSDLKFAVDKFFDNREDFLCVILNNDELLDCKN